MATILSIQSWVAYGHVGNAAAVFPLQRLGHEVWPIHTVQFSNHPGYGGFGGTVFDPAQIAAIVKGLHDRGVLARCDAVLSGYLGDAGTAEVVLDAVKRVRAANPKAIVCCDPVMGDDGSGLFVRAGIPEAFRTRLLPAADIATPNRFELEQLVDRRIATLDDAVSAARRLMHNGPRLVAVTGLKAPIITAGQIGIAAVTPESAWLAVTPDLAFDPVPNGTGDLFAALFLAHVLGGHGPAEALSRAISSLFAVLERAAAQGLREMPLIAAQGLLANPPHVIPTRRAFG